MGIRLDGAARIITYPILQQSVCDRCIWIAFKIAADVSPERRCRGPVRETIAQGMEEARAISRLRNNPGISDDMDYFLAVTRC